MTHRTIVYTCVTNNRDPLRDDQHVGDSQFVAFVDSPVQSNVWSQVAIEPGTMSARRTARRHKLLAHQYVDAPFSLWQDANVALLVPVRQLCDEWLLDCDLAVFRHRTRRCLYEEARVCMEKNLDSHDLIRRQVDRYALAGFPPSAGLAETSIVLRRHSARMERFNEIWWDELCAGSVRDQISFMVALQRSGLRCHFVTPTKFKHPYFSMTVRPPGAESTE
jgi:hypothetical protein